MDKEKNENHFGYKNHVKVDNTHKFIDTQHTTDAYVRDSQALDNLLDEEKWVATFGWTVAMAGKSKIKR